MLSTQDLIRLIQQRPALWNRHCFEYKDRTAKEQAWSEIYREIEPSYENWKKSMQLSFGASVAKKWYNIRDSYAKSRRSGASKRSRPYIYADMLSFLDPIYNIEEKEEGYDKNDETISDNFENEIYLEVDDENDAKRPKIDETIDDQGIVAVLANLIQKEEDEDRAFLKSLTPAVKTLSEDSKFEFRIQVLNLIKKLRQKDGLMKVKIEKVTTDNDALGNDNNCSDSD